MCSTRGQSGKSGRTQPLRLDAVLEPGETQLFFIFRDPTAGKTTYGAGRFLYADPPVERQGRPRLQPRLLAAVRVHAARDLSAAAANNRLPVAIEAGEMFAGHH